MTPRLPPKRSAMSSIDGLLPRSLLTLTVCYDYSPLSPSTFRPNLRELHLESTAEPPFRPSLLPGSLPESLFSLVYDVAEDIACGVLPSSPRQLHVATKQYRRRKDVGLTPGCLPAGLIELCWDGAIGNGLVAGLLPASLHVLRLADRSFNGSLDASSHRSRSWSICALEVGTSTIPSTSTLCPAR
jgi:hypothetical protein